MRPNKSRRMVGGSTTPRLPPAAPRASRRAPLVNIENIGGESMGEEAFVGVPPIHLMYDGDTAAEAAAPGYVGAPAALSGLVAPTHFSSSIAGQPSPRIRGRARRKNPFVASPAGDAPLVPRALFAPSPAGTPYVPLDGGPASPEGDARLLPRTLFHPGRMQDGGRKRKITKRPATKKMVGGTTTPIIPPFLSPMAAAPASPPPALRAPLPAAAYAAPYSHEAMRGLLPVGTPAPGQSLEDFQDKMLEQQLQQQARPVFAASPYVSRYGLPPINARLRRPQAAFAAPPPFAANVPNDGTPSPLGRRALFQDDSTTPTDMEGGTRRRRATKKRGAIRRRFNGQRGGWPFSCTGSKCTAAVAPAPLTPEQLNYIQYKPGGVGRGWKCPICEVISPVLEYTDRYVRGSRANNEDGYYAHTCPACQHEIPGMEENIRIQEGQAAVQRLVSEEQVASAAEDLRRLARELEVSEENIENKNT